jgi:hypothetical protein
MEFKDYTIKRWIPKIFIISSTLILCLIFLEIGLRIIGRMPSNMTDGIYEHFGDTYRLKKDVEKTTNWLAYSYITYSNSFGFRDKASIKRDIVNNEYYVFLGASEVFANGVDFEESFVGIFADYASRYKIEVLNMALGGHYFLDQEDLFKDFLNNVSRKPSKVFFCLNALHIPKFDKRNQHLVVKNGYILPEDGWVLAFIKTTISNISSAFCFFRDGIRKIQSQWFDYKVSNDKPEFIEIYSKQNRMYNPKTLQKFEDFLGSFENYCEKNNIEVVYVYLPITDSFRLNDFVKQYGMDPDDFDTTYYSNYMNEYCQKKGIKYLNLRPILIEHFNEGKELRFKLDPHYNVFANRIVGEFIYSKVFSQDGVNLLSK